MPLTNDTEVHSSSFGNHLSDHSRDVYNLDDFPQEINRQKKVIEDNESCNVLGKESNLTTHFSTSLHLRSENSKEPTESHFVHSQNPKIHIISCTTLPNKWSENQFSGKNLNNIIDDKKSQGCSEPSDDEVSTIIVKWL